MEQTPWKVSAIWLVGKPLMFPAMANWFQRQMPHLQPILRQLDETIRATIPGLHYAVKWKRPYYGSSELGWIIELAAYDVRGLPPPAGTRIHRPFPLCQGDHPGGGTATGAARLARAGEPNPGLEVKGTAPNRRCGAKTRCGTTRLLAGVATGRSCP